MIKYFISFLLLVFTFNVNANCEHTKGKENKDAHYQKLINEDKQEIDKYYNILYKRYIHNGTKRRMLRDTKVDTDVIAKFNCNNKQCVYKVYSDRLRFLKKEMKK